LPTRTRGPRRSKRLLAFASDERLVEHIRRGNEAAFEVVFERYGKGLLSFCRHMLGSQEEAEDAVQLTFASAYDDLQRDHDRELRLKPWLYTIARNRCLSMLRARRDELHVEREPATAGLAEQVERRAELREVLQDIGKLPAEQRAAVLLAEAADLSHAEIADVLDCEVPQVKALVYRARSALIERRDARATPCQEIREQLAVLSGGSLRRRRPTCSAQPAAAEP
jgi:RNA polymerase sigma factor (sigma-70 family)